jgi:hypothetical protein
MMQKADTEYSDTSRKTSAAHSQILRQMGMAGRAKLTFQLCDTLRQTTCKEKGSGAFLT